MENLLCYLSNAEKYSATGTISVSCSVYRGDGGGGAKGKGDNCPGTSGLFFRMAVEDEGIGVSDSMAELLFQPFQQAMRLAGGTGLGLYSLAKRVEALHGEYGVMGRGDGKQGSQFWFSVPYMPDESCSTDLTQSTRIIASAHSQTWHIEEVQMTPSHSSSDLTALVVEDTVVVSKATSRMLTKAGYQVDCASNGAVGLEKMKEKHYDLVLMDLQMPIMDGLEATRRFRNFEREQSDQSECKRAAQQLIIGVSANDYDGVIKEALSCGMNDFISKPFSLQKLFEYQNKKEDIDSDSFPL